MKVAKIAWFIIYCALGSFFASVLLATTLSLALRENLTENASPVL